MTAVTRSFQRQQPDWLYAYHIVVWQARRWCQIDQGVAAVDDFGTLVTVFRP